MSKISVCIPCYNHAAFLKQRIDSVLNQSCQDFELIILDDCSTDNSKEIIEQYRNHPKVQHIVYNEVNSGSTFKQWQKGIELTTGDYIWIAESDDYADLEFLKETIAPILSNDEIVFSYCRSMEVTEGNENIHGWGESIEPQFWNSSSTVDGKQFIKRFLRFRNVIPNASAVIFSKKAFLKTGFNTQMQFAGDWLIWNELASLGKVSFVAKPLNFFRQHSTTTRSIKSFMLERKRTQEYIKTIRKANRLINLRWNPFDPHYNWILAEWPSRTKSKFRFWFPPYPFLLLLSYYKFRFFKK